MTYEEAIEKIKEIPQQWHLIESGTKFGEILTNKTEVLKALKAMDIYCFLYSHLPRFIDPIISEYIIDIPVKPGYKDFHFEKLIKSGLNYILSFLKLDKSVLQRDIEYWNDLTFNTYKDFDPDNQTAAYKDPQYVNEDKLKTIFKIVDNIKKNQELLKVFAGEVIFRFMIDLRILSAFTRVDRSRFDNETLEFLDNRYVELYQKYWRIDLKDYDYTYRNPDPSFYGGIGGFYPSSILQNKVLPIYKLVYYHSGSNIGKKHSLRYKIQMANYQINGYPDPADFVFPEKEMNAIPFPYNEISSADNDNELSVKNISDEEMSQMFRTLSLFYDILNAYFSWDYDREWYPLFLSIEDNPEKKRIAEIIDEWFGWDDINEFISFLKAFQEDPEDHDPYKVYKDEIDHFTNLVKNTNINGDINRLYTAYDYDKNIKMEDLNPNVLADKIKRTFAGGFLLNTGIINCCLFYEIKDKLQGMKSDLFIKIRHSLENWLFINRGGKQVIHTRYLIDFLDALGYCHRRNRRYEETIILSDICYYILHFYEKEDKTEELLESINKLLGNDELDLVIHEYMILLKKGVQYSCDKEKYPLSTQDMEGYRGEDFSYSENVPFILRGRSI